MNQLNTRELSEELDVVTDSLRDLNGRLDEIKARVKEGADIDGNELDTIEKQIIQLQAKASGE